MRVTGPAADTLASRAVKRGKLKLFVRGRPPWSRQAHTGHWVIAFDLGDFMTHMARADIDRRERRAFGEPVGAWTAEHTLGAVIVMLLFLGLALNFWHRWF